MTAAGPGAVLAALALEVACASAQGELFYRGPPGGDWTLRVDRCEGAAAGDEGTGQGPLLDTVLVGRNGARIGISAKRKAGTHKTVVDLVNLSDPRRPWVHLEKGWEVDRDAPPGGYVCSVLDADSDVVSVDDTPSLSDEVSGRLSHGDMHPARSGHARLDCRNALGGTVRGHVGYSSCRSR